MVRSAPLTPTVSGVLHALSEQMQERRGSVKKHNDANRELAYTKEGN